MKHKLGIFVIILLFVFLFWNGIKSLLVDSFLCKKTNEVKVSDFKKNQKITITPKENCSNLGYLYSLKGEISDTLVIDNRVYKKGEIDTVITNIDYYGGHPVSVVIEKNSNTKGYLIVKQKIL